MFSPDVVPDLRVAVKVEDPKSEKGSRLTEPASSGESSGDDLTVLNPDEGKKSLEEVRKQKWAYELNHHFQDNLAQKLPWVKAVNDTSEVHNLLAYDWAIKASCCQTQFLWWKYVGRCRAEKDMYEGKKLKVKLETYIF